MAKETLTPKQAEARISSLQKQVADVEKRITANSDKRALLGSAGTELNLQRDSLAVEIEALQDLLEKDSDHEKAKAKFIAAVSIESEESVGSPGA